jgi:hypothetical protein
MRKRISILSEAIALSPEDFVSSPAHGQYIHIVCHVLACTNP